MADTKTVYHPDFKGMSREVPVGDANKWKAMGWRFTPVPEKSEPKPVEAEVEVPEGE